METKAMTVRELTAQMVVEAKRLGFSEATIWRGWMPGEPLVYHPSPLITTQNYSFAQ